MYVFIQSALLNPKKVSCLVFVFFLAAMICGAELFAPGRAGAREMDAKTILVLHSYHQGSPWTDATQSGISNTLGLSSIPVKTLVECLGAGLKIDLDQTGRAIADYFAVKYKNISFDVIIACDDVAIRFMKRFRDVLFPHVPVVFCGLDLYEESFFRGVKDFIGVSEEIAIIETMELALSLHPKAEHIFIFTDDISVHVPQTPSIIARLGRMKQRTDIQIIEGLRLDGAVDALLKMPENSVLLLINISLDEKGRPILWEKASEILSATRPIPIYACWDFYLNHGAVGGKMINGFSQGRAAARTAMQILEGVPLSQLPPIRKGPTAYMADYTQMKRFGLTGSMLPDGCRIINQPATFFERHKKLFQISLGTSIGLLLAVAILTISLIRTRKIQENLKESEQKAKALLHAIPDLMFRVNKKGIFQDYKADQVDLFRKDIDSLTGLHLNQIVPVYFAEKAMKYISLTLHENKMQTFEYELEIQGKGLCRYEARMVPSGHDEVIIIARDISEKKRVEETIRHHELKLHHLIQNLQIGIVLHGPDTRILDFNNAALEILGQTPEMIMGAKADSPIWRFMGEDKSELPLDQYPVMQVLKTRQRLKDKIVGIKKSDSKKPVWTLVNAAPNLDVNGNVTEVIVSILDMTDRKKGMEALRASQRRYRSIYEGTPLIATTWQSVRDDFVLLDANLAAEELSNQTILNQIGTRASVFHQDHPWLVKAMHDCHQLKTRTQIEGRYPLRETGEERYFRFFLNHIPPDMVLVLAQDLTENTRTREALTRREAQFRVLFESALDAIFFLDASGKALDANLAACRLFQIEKESLHEWSISDLAPSFSRPLLERLVKEKPRTLELADVTLKKPDGTLFSGSLRSFRSTVQGETVIFLFIHDLTRQKEEEGKKRKLESQLRRARKMESIGNLAGGIAHDFNNILSSIIGYTELAIEDAEKGSELEDDLKEIYMAGKRARDLVRQILAFARQSDEHLRPTRMSGIVKEALKLIRSSIPSSIEIVQQIESDDLIMGIPTQVHQLVINLCTNAAQAMTDETGVLGVELKTVTLDENFTESYLDLAAGEHLKLSVSDTGIGIPAELKEVIFEPYFTTKKPGEGTGMGLATVHGIVKRYGGEITLESEVGKGSAFHVYLPVTYFPLNEEDRPSEKAPTGTERILFVDDEPSIAKMGKKALTRLGYQVITQTNSANALDLFAARPMDFDMVITDMTMPGLTGESLAMEIHRIRPDLPVIICTGFSNKLSGKTATKTDNSTIFHKPILKIELAKVVRETLDAARN